jgi:hypothetical protein
MRAGILKLCRQTEEISIGLMQCDVYILQGHRFIFILQLLPDASSVGGTAVDQIYTSIYTYRVAQKKMTFLKHNGKNEPSNGSE